MTASTSLENTANGKGWHPLETTQVAWMVLGSAFLVFCLICMGVTFGAYFHVFQSTVPMFSVVQVSTGSVRLVRTDNTEYFEEVGRPISGGERVVTDSQSQAVVSFRDDDNHNELVSSVTVKNNSEVQVMRGRRPRFGRSGVGYSVAVTLTAGEIDVFVPALLNREIGVTVYLPGNTLVDIAESGDYTLSLTEEGLQLVTHEGRAAILPPNRDASRPVVTGQVATYMAETGEIMTEPQYIDLVDNATFEAAPVEGFRAIDIWNCGDKTPQSPTGIFEQVFFEGRYTVRLFRGIGTESHGETECIQPFGPSAIVGQRVDGFNSLELRTSFYVQGHSLDVCGERGSECPMMLLMDYIDENGNSNQWFQGFYAQLTSRLDYPLTCASCSRDHKRINDGVWYTYESGNLFALLPEGARPTSILNVRFYASGHDYDVYMSNLSLLASSPDPAVTTPESTAAR